MNRFFFTITCIVFCVFLFHGVGECETNLIAMKTVDKITIDGQNKEAVWQKAEPLTIHDPIAKLKITLKALYSDKKVYISVQFPDSDENRAHKKWVWDTSKKLYKIGPNREDVFVVKWFIEFDPNGLSLYAGKPHKADIWYWKADRTDPKGYADDKIQYLQTKYEKRATKIISTAGTPLYLIRKGDRGDSAYTTRLVVEYTGEKVQRFDHRIPSGSRADVRAKGLWHKGVWTIEFARLLKTGQNDDINLDIRNTYTLGVSLLEIAGRGMEKGSEKPLFGSGDIHQGIVLSFKD